MSRLVWIVLVLGMVFSSCSKKEKPVDGKSPEEKAIQEMLNSALVRLEVQPTPPTVSDSIALIPELNLKYRRGNQFQLQCQWFVNNREIQAVTDLRLTSVHFKRGDQVRALVKAVRGKLESSAREVPAFTIANAAPTFIVGSVSPFKVPGVFTYQIQASDPDGDPLIFRLLEPLNRGIQVNPKTGEVSWKLAEIPTLGPDQQPSPYVRLVFEAEDTQKAKCQIILNLNLETGTEVPK